GDIGESLAGVETEHHHRAPFGIANVQDGPQLIQTESATLVAAVGLFDRIEELRRVLANDRIAPGGTKDHSGDSQVMVGGAPTYPGGEVIAIGHQVGLDVSLIGPSTLSPRKVSSRAAASE